MQKAYNRINWANSPSEETPINEANLNRMDGAIDTLDNRIIEMNMTMQEPVTKSAASAAAAKESANAAAASAATAKTDAKKAEDAADRAVAVAGFTVDTSLNENSPNPVTNKATTKGIIQTGESGARNLVPFPYYEKAGTESGITWTVNDDGTIGVSGTAEANVSFTIRATSENWTLKKGTYTLGGCPSGGSFTGYRLQLARFVDGTLTSYANDYGSGISFEITDELPLLMQFVVASGVTIDATVEPMLERGGVKHSFVPYYFGVAEKAKTAENANALGGLDSTEFLRLNGNGGVISYTNFDALKIKRKTTSNAGIVGFVFENDNGIIGMVGFKNGKLYKTGKNANASDSFEIFDTSNKPSGTYTGDGVRAQRTINIGNAIGKILVIHSAEYLAFVDENGANYVNRTTNTMTRYMGSEISFDGTDLMLNLGVPVPESGSDTNVFNRSGYLYSYEVL